MNNPKLFFRENSWTERNVTGLESIQHTKINRSQYLTDSIRNNLQNLWWEMTDLLRQVLYPRWRHSSIFQMESQYYFSKLVCYNMEGKNQTHSTNLSSEACHTYYVVTKSSTRALLLRSFADSQITTNRNLKQAFCGSFTAYQHCWCQPHKLSKLSISLNNYSQICASSSKENTFNQRPLFHYSDFNSNSKQRSRMVNP